MSRQFIFDAIAFVVIVLLAVYALDLMVFGADRPGLFF